MPQFGGREVFYRGNFRRKDRYVSVSTVVSGEAQRWGGPRHRLEVMWPYYLFCSTGPVWRRIPEAAEAETETKREVGADSEELKCI